jgi:dipeptidyl aminopeptidase/acylaminoacyl peptidase
VGADPVSSAAFLRKEVAGVVTFAVAGESGKVREIVTLNRHMADSQLGSWQELSYRIEAGDGNSETLTSCILLPADFDPARPPPLIVDVYPNVSSPCPEVPRGLAFPDPASPYVWAGKGYAYIRPATPRSLIRMKDGPLAGLPSVLAAAISEADSRGFIDADKVVLHGFSQGAVSALYVAAKPGTYRAVIARNGWADLFSHYFGPAGAYAYTGGRFGEFGRYDRAVGSDFNFGRTPFDDPEAYYRNSPVFLANRIDASVLLVHSDLDSFSEHQFDEMYGALLRAGKKVRYVRYLGEGHGPSSPANIRDLWHRMELFLSEAGASP